MFKRPHQTKPAAPISSSARKKLINEACSAFFCHNPLLPAQKNLVQKLIPEGLRMARVSTHLNNSLLLYTDMDGQPLWFKLDKGQGILVPSLYTLSRYPSLLPVLRTNQTVLLKLTGGADLMAPGLDASSKQKLAGLTAHTLVAISGVEPQTEGPWAVGYLTGSGDELVMSSTGKVVVTLHAKEDFLWQAGSKITTSKLTMELPTHEPIPSSLEAQLIDAASVHQTPTLQPAVVEPQKCASPLPKLSCEEVDKILQAALQRCMLDHTPADIPMPASAFYSNYILPLRPHDCPKTAGVKDSSSKTLAKWLKAMQKKGFLVIKEERKGGELMLCSLNTAHESLLSTSRYRTMADLEKDAAKQKANDLTSTHPEPGEAVSAQGTLVSRFLKTTNVAQEQLFTNVNVDPKGLHDQRAVRQIFNLHLQSKGYAQRLIQVDELLGDAIGSNRPRHPSTREELLACLMEAFEDWWRLERGGEILVEKKGTAPTITMSMKKGSGNRHATRILGLEIYGIEPVTLAKQLRTLCAVSTSIHPSPTSPSLQLPKSMLKDGPPVEVHCQGDQRVIVKKYLIENTGVPKTAIVDK